MNDVALHPTPRWGAVVREQFGSVGAGLRRELIAGAALVLGMTVLTFIAGARGAARPVDLSPDDFGFVLGWIGLLAPLAVWKGEGPSKRDYLWSLPLARERHTLVKVLSGWAWLMISIAAFFLVIAFQIWIMGGTFGENGMRYVVPDAFAPAAGVTVDQALLRTVQWTTPVWQWLVPFVAPTVMYIIGTIAALLSDHPWRWLALPFIAFGLLIAFESAADASWISDFGKQLEKGTYGLATLFTGSNEVAMRVDTTAGSDVLVWRNLAEARQWFTTALIWFVPALAGVLLAAHRYQER